MVIVSIVKKKREFIMHISIFPQNPIFWRQCMTRNETNSRCTESHCQRHPAQMQYRENEKFSIISLPLTSGIMKRKISGNSTSFVRGSMEPSNSWLMKISSHQLSVDLDPPFTAWRKYRNNYIKAH